MTAMRREDAMNDFRHGDAAILVTSDACSRAVNLNVDVVINYGAPTQMGVEFHSKVYNFRTSRTGRFNKSGLAITLNTGIDTDIVKVMKRDFNVSINLI